MPRLYDTRHWQRVRAQVLAESPQCERCGSQATEVHHQVPVRHGGGTGKLVALCKRCHSAATLAETRGVRLKDKSIDPKTGYSKGALLRWSKKSVS